MPPPQLDAYGPGMRVPTWAISPHANREHLESTLYEHSSVLELIETMFGLPTIASAGDQFGQSTPGRTNNQATAGAARRLIFAEESSRKAPLLCYLSLE